MSLKSMSIISQDATTRTFDYNAEVYQNQVITAYNSGFRKVKYNSAHTTFLGLTEETNIVAGGLETTSIIDGTRYAVSVRTSVASAIRIDVDDLTVWNSYTLDFTGFHASPQPVTGYIISLQASP